MCAGYSVDSWAMGPPTTCQLHTQVDRLVDAPCAPSSSQLAAFFLKPGSEPASHPLPYQQFAGRMPSDRVNTAAVINCDGNATIAFEACDADPLCIGVNLLGCSVEAPGSTCWTVHKEAAPTLVPNTIDHACFYLKPNSSAPPAPLPPPKSWACQRESNLPPSCTYPYGCEFMSSRWSDGTPAFNCKMRLLAWQFGREKRPDYGLFEDLYYALGLNSGGMNGEDCSAELPVPPNFTQADRSPAPKLYHQGANPLYVDYRKGVDTNRGTLGSPVKTIQAAVNAATATTTINLRGGTHYLSSAVQITAASSGITIQNYNGEAVVVSGAARLEMLQWIKHDLGSQGGPNANAFVADVSVSAAGLTEFPGFQVDGVRVTRARYPNGNVELPERTQYGTFVHPICPILSFLFILPHINGKVVRK